MKFLKNNISYNTNEIYLSDNSNPVYNCEKKTFLSLKLFIQVIIASIYAFGLGYSLFYVDEVIKNGLIFLVLLALNYLIIIIIHELLHVLCYPANDKVIIRYSLSRLTFFSSSDENVSKIRSLLLLILPFITLTVFPSIISYSLGFNMFLYAFASANAIKSGSDLLNIVLIIKNVPKDGYLKIFGDNFYLETMKINESISTNSNIIDVD